MNREERNKLVKQYKSRTEALIKRAAAGAKPDEIKHDLEGIENYNKLLALAADQHWTADAKYAIVFGLLCLVVASILWSCQVKSSGISLTADTDSVNGHLFSKWHLENPLQGSVIQIERASRIDAANLGVSLDSKQGDAWVRLEGGQVNLQSLDIDKGAVVSLSADPRQLSVFVSGEPAYGTITVVGKVMVTAGESTAAAATTQTYNIEIPETLEFVIRPPRSVPSRLSIRDLPEKWSLGRAPFANLDFSHEEVRDVTEVVFTSGIRSGTLIMNDIGGAVRPISEGEFVVIQDVGQSVTEISGKEPLIHVALNGLVKGVTVGQGNDRRDVAPSYLEYLYNTKKVGFFWGLVVGIWGVIWGIRKTIFR